MKHLEPIDTTQGHRIGGRPSAPPGVRDAARDGTRGVARGAARHGRTGYVPGVFDMFHIGHLNLLRHARSHCDWLIAGVVSDDNCERAKGKQPVVPFAERIEIVSHCTLVDEAVGEFVDTKQQMWELLRFDVIFKGDDWRGTAKGAALESAFSRLGVEVVYFPYTVRTSSTLLRSALTRLSTG